MTPETIASFAPVDWLGYSVLDIAFSPEGTTLASGYALYWRGGLDQPSTILLWNLDTRSVKSLLSGHLGYVSAVAFNPKGGQLASGGWDGTAHLWNTSTGDSITILEGHPLSKDEAPMMNGTTLKMLPVQSLAFSPDGSLLAVGGGCIWGPGFLDLYDTTTGSLRESRFLNDCTGGVSISFSPDGHLIATEEGDGLIRLRDGSTFEVRRQLSDAHRFGKVVFSPDGKILATVEVLIAEEGIRGGVHFWDVETGEGLDLLDVGVESVSSIAFSPDGKLLAVGHHNGNVVVWDMAGRKAAIQVDCGQNPVVGFSPNGSLLAIGDANGAINLWSVPEQ